MTFKVIWLRVDMRESIYNTVRYKEIDFYSLLINKREIKVMENT